MSSTRNESSSPLKIPSDLRPGEPVLVSACVVGEAVRYTGDSNPDRALLDALRAAGAEIVPVCPEILGGLSAPRPPAEMNSGDGGDAWSGSVRLHTVGSMPDGSAGPPVGTDVTEEFLAGARQALAIAEARGARYAFLKERSPSCGVNQTHSGGALVDGPGVTTAALREAGLIVFPALA